MATLSRELRKALERVVLAARREAEAGARKALDQLAVAHHEPWPTMASDRQSLRRRLRARGRQLGDRLEDRGKQGIEHLVAEFAYEQWHRMLFARFLAECGLLIEPASGVPVSVDECKELARERGVDWISLTSAFAQGMLPQIFRADDVVLEITLPAEHRQPLEQLLISLPTEVFLADDSLGWVYQFWQSDKKASVNASAIKIGPDELPVVTQLFTDDYMVNFLLHNTLGAWWVGRRFPDGVEAQSEDGARLAASLPNVGWTFLRLAKNAAGRWIPMAGTFGQWPRSIRRLRILDPCMGSGHFLVFALPILVALWIEEEGTPQPGACAAALRDNLFGLEIDPRCTQIAAFNIALAAWKIAGWQPLPALNVACSGLGLNLEKHEWVQLAGEDGKAKQGMEQLYDLFAQAPMLGSLISPRNQGGDLLASGFTELRPLIDKALHDQKAGEEIHELAVLAKGAFEALQILAAPFTLVVTNVPYLGRGKQNETLKRFCESHHQDAKADLAACFIERGIAFCEPGGTLAAVTPNYWLFLNKYTRLRKRLLIESGFNVIARLGAGAFEAVSGEIVNVCLLCLSNTKPPSNQMFAGVDVGAAKQAADKSDALTQWQTNSVSQHSQLANPDFTITVAEVSVSETLGKYIHSYHGITTTDYPRFSRCFWESEQWSAAWVFQQGSVESSRAFGGRECVLLWEDGKGGIKSLQDSGAPVVITGLEAWGKRGVVVNRVGRLPATLYTGDAFDTGVAILIPDEEANLPALWAFCSSPEFAKTIRQFNQQVIVEYVYYPKVPFDLNRWQRVAQGMFPSGLPRPDSVDPTQWLFEGRPSHSEHPLQVAVCRLLGYNWPRQNGVPFIGCETIDQDTLRLLVATDGIVCVSPLRGDESAAERVRSILSAEYANDWSASTLEQLLASVGYAGKTLEDWLRNGFFQQHCELFHQRPFVWHLWDGHRDGFSALVNYHRLSRANLERLTYGQQGDWIRRQQAADGANEAGSESRLIAAKQLQDELKNILEGQPPYDIFARWRPLSRQVIGWEPDFEDGVRVNIRPFLMAADVGKKGAGILRVKPNVKWDKDRGKEPSRSKDEFPWFWEWDGKAKDFGGGSTFDGNRWNDLHYSREFKMAVRRQKGLA